MPSLGGNGSLKCGLFLRKALRYGTLGKFAKLGGVWIFEARSTDPLKSARTVDQRLEIEDLVCVICA